MNYIKKLKDYINNITLTNITNVYVCIITIIVPCLFLPYNSTFTNQLCVTLVISLLWTMYFLLTNLAATIKNKSIITKTSSFKIKDVFKKIDILDYVVIVYLILVTLSSILSTYFPMTILGTGGRCEGLITILLYFFAFYVTYKYASINKKMVYAFCVSLCIVALVGLIEYLFFDHPARSSFGNQNFLSSYLCMFLPVVMLLYVDTKKIIYLVTSSLTFGCLYASCTSGGYITFFIIAILVTVYTFIQKKKNLKQLGILFLIFTIILVIINIINPAAWAEFANINKELALTFQKNGLGLNGRIQIFKTAIDMTLKHPILGVGTDCFGLEVFENYIFTNEWQEILGFQHSNKAHSEYLQISACCGIPALIVYIVFIGIIGIRLWKCFLKDKKNIYVFAVRS